MAEKQASLQSTVETIYRFTADDYTREEALRVQRTIESIHKRELKERDDRIAEQNATITKQSSTIAELDATVTELDTTVTKQNEEIKQLRKQIETLQRQVSANL